jgi:hypothetical protein
MPDNPKAQDSLSPAVKDRSVTQGDVPDALKRRYYTEERGGDGLGFYVDARIQTPAFRDRGRALVATRLDPNAIRDMTVIAEHRGWTIVQARGSAGFRREAWLAGRSIGLEVRGYRPTERDLQELQRRQDQAQRAADRREVRSERREDRRDRGADEGEVRRERREDAGARSSLRVVDAVVRARVADPERQERIMASARERIANWLEQGGRFSAIGNLDREIRSSPDRRRER